MTKSELLDRLGVRFPHLSSHDFALSVNCIMALFVETLMRGERVEIRGFGTFSVRRYEQRLGRNPKTGEPVEVPKRSILYFRAARELKERVNATMVEQESL